MNRTLLTATMNKYIRVLIIFNMKNIENMHVEQNQIYICNFTYHKNLFVQKRYSRIIVKRITGQSII